MEDEARDCKRGEDIERRFAGVTCIWNNFMKKYLITTTETFDLVPRHYYKSSFPI